MSSISHPQIVILDDNRQTRFLVRSILRAAGIHDCYESGSANEALDLIRIMTPDLVITDLAMGPVSGLTFTETVRRSPASPNPYQRILLMTGYSDHARVAAARDAGVHGVLAKPISARSLLEKVHLILRDDRPFVRCAEYFGPDRRHGAPKRFEGPFRRRTDHLDRFDLDALATA